MQKELIINGKKYADYQVEGEILFLKVHPPSTHKNIDFQLNQNIGAMEDCLTEIIIVIEDVKITAKGYLNV